eukprot:1154741-Prymnesium_polylepis.1
MIKLQALEGVRELRDVDLAAALRDGGAFLLDGYLNASYVRGSKRVRVKVADAGSKWRHSTAVVDGK